MDRTHSINNESSAISTLRFFSQFICHRIPERTFQIKGNYFPICSRCTGLYIGAFSYFVFVYIFYVNYNIFLFLIAILLMIPTFLDGITQYFGLRESFNALRFLTGLIGGLGFGITIKAVKYLIFC